MKYKKWIVKARICFCLCISGRRINKYRDIYKIRLIRISKSFCLLKTIYVLSSLHEVISSFLSISIRKLNLKNSKTATNFLRVFLSNLCLFCVTKVKVKSFSNHYPVRLRNLLDSWFFFDFSSRRICAKVCLFFV